MLLHSFCRKKERGKECYHRRFLRLSDHELLWQDNFIHSKCSEHQLTDKIHLLLVFILFDVDRWNRIWSLKLPTATLSDTRYHVSGVFWIPLFPTLYAWAVGRLPRAQLTSFLPPPHSNGSSLLNVSKGSSMNCHKKITFMLLEIWQRDQRCGSSE